MATADLVRKNPFEETGDFSRGESRGLTWSVLRHLLVSALFGIPLFLFYQGEVAQDIIPLLLLLFFVVTMVNPIYGIAALIVCIGVSPDSVGANNVRLEDYLIPPLLLIYWIKRNSPSQDFVRSDISSPVKVYLFICIFASLKGYLMNTIWGPVMSVQFFFKYLEYFLLMWLAMQAIHKKEDLIFVLLMSFIVCGLVAYLAYSSRQEVLNRYEYSFVRASGPQGETPNVLGGYYLVHIMFAFSMLFSTKNYLYRILLIGFLLAVAMPLLYTYSRTSFTSVIVGLLVTCLFIDFRYIVILFILVFFNQLLLPQMNDLSVDESFIDRYSTIFEIFGDDSSKPSSWTARMMGWYVYYIKTWMSDPLFGRGLGSVGLGIDSSFVKKFVETGLIGLLSFVVILVRLGRMAVDVSRQMKDPIRKGVAIGYLGLLVGMSVHAIGVSSFSTIRTAEPFFFFSGVLVGIYVRMRRNQERELEEGKEVKSLRFNAR